MARFHVAITPGYSTTPKIAIIAGQTHSEHLEQPGEEFQVGINNIPKNFKGA